MKNKLLVILLVTCSFAALARPADLLVLSRTTGPWNLFLVDEIQQLLKNIGEDIQLSRAQATGEAITYDNSTLEEMLTEESNEFLQTLEELSGLGILQIKPEFSIHSMGYDVYNVSSDIKLATVENGVEVDSSIIFNGVDIFADSFDINFVLPQLVKNKKVIALNIKIIKPQIRFLPGVVLPLKLKVILEKVARGLKVNLKDLDLNELAENLKSSVDAFDFEFEDIGISDVKLTLMGRTITVNEKKIEELVLSYKDDLKRIIVEQLANIIKEGRVGPLLKLYDGQIIETDKWFFTKAESNYPLLMQLDHVGKLAEDIFMLEATGEICAKATYAKYGKNCTQHQELSAFPSTITPAMENQSLENIKGIFQNGAGFMASASENYLTKIIHGTIENHQWDDLLKDFKIKLGPKSAFLRFDEHGDSGLLYIDAVYNVGRFQGMLLRQRNINFPIVLKIKPRVEYRDVEVEYEEGIDIVTDFGLQAPIVFTITDVLIEDRVLRYGVKKYGLRSSIQDIRYGLRSTVIKKIRKDLFQYDKETNQYRDSKWIGVDLPPIVMPELNNLNLEKLHFESDGVGRGNFFFNEQDIQERE